MIILATAINFICVFGLIFVALRYLIGPVPVDYHEAILKTARQPTDGAVRDILRVMYRGLGISYLGVALLIASLSYFGTMNGVVWAEVTVVLATWLVGILSTLVARSLELRHGERTPWRASSALTIAMTIGFVFFLL